MTTKKRFIKEYAKAIRNGNAAVFAGAGLSRPSGFVIWKDLLKPLAEEINLDIDGEHDLPTVAQYIKNKHGNRSSINTEIIEAYSSNIKNNENIDILTRLPVHTYWTTNYDHLMEEGFRAANRKVDIKIESKQLSTTMKDRDAILYKMHGDVDHASDAVLTKDDYIQYDMKHPFFRNVLQGDLISKTFLFIGFSFDDPNLDGILGQLKLLLDENIRTHYCFMKRVDKKDFKGKDYIKQKTKEELREQNLSRYGVQTVYINSFDEINSILKQVEKKIKSWNVFISGSIDVYDENWSKKRVDELTYKLSGQLVKNGYKITSGFGLGIGSSIINGALSVIYSNHYKIEDHLLLRPFPQLPKDKMNQKKYREEMIKENGVSIFLFGNKRNKAGEKINAQGCIQEYTIAKKNGCLIIPVASTGNAALEIYRKNKANNKDIKEISKEIDKIKDSKEIDIIIESISNILEINTKLM